MQMRIQGRNIELTQAIRQHIRERVTAALDQHASRVRQVAVTVSDINGPRGGVDQLCNVVVSLRGGKTLRHSRKGEDLYANVSLVADKVKRRVGREIAKLRQVRR